MTDKYKLGGIFPLIYWSKGDGHTFLPFYLHNYDKKDFSFYGPYWRNDETDHGVWPLYSYEKNDSLRILNYYQTDQKHLLFPFYKSYSDENRTDFDLLLGLIWNHQENTNGDYKTRQFPFFWSHGNRKNGQVSEMFLPFYYHNKHGETNNWQTLIGHSYDNGKEQRKAIYPLYFSNSKPESSSELFLPFYYQQKVNGEDLVVTPLGGYSHDETGKNSFLNVLGPLYIDRTKDKHFFKSVLWPFYINLGDENVEKTFVPPFYYNRTTADKSDSKYLLGLGASVTKNDKTSWRITPFYSNQKQNGVYNDFYDFALIGHKELSLDRSKDWFFPFYSNESDGDNNSFDGVLGLMNWDRRGEDDNFRIWPLYSTREFQQNDPLYDFTFAGTKSYGNQSENWLFPLYSYKEEGDKYDFKTVATFIRSYQVNENRHGWRVWPFYSTKTVDDDHKRITSAPSEVIDNDFLDFIGTAYHSYDFGSTHGYSFLGSLGFKHKTSLKYGAKIPSSENSFLLFGSSDEINYSAEQIPNVRGSHAQNTVQQSDNSFLLYNSSKVEYILWKEGVFTQKEMNLIESAQSRLLNNYQVVMPSRSSLKVAPDSSSRYNGSHNYWKLNRDELKKELVALLNRKGVLYKSTDKGDLLQALKDFARNNNERQVEESSSLWPIYDTASNGENYQTEVLFGIYNSKMVNGKGRTSLLKYLYRCDEENGNKRRDIFPFITVDSGEDSGFSFLGKFLNIRSGYGNIFFIPYGDKK